MDTLSLVALVVLLLIAALIGVLIWFLGGLPGKIAAERCHPFTQAIQIGGWATLLLGAVGWPFVLMWAYRSPASNIGQLSIGDTNGDLRREVESLKTQVEALSTLVKGHQSSGGKS